MSGSLGIQLLEGQIDPFEVFRLAFAGVAFVAVIGLGVLLYIMWKELNG